MVGIMLLNFLLQLYLTATPVQSTYVILLLVGSGFFFLSTGWLISMLIMISLGWSSVVQALPPSPDWLQVGFALATAAALSLAIHLVQMRNSQQVIHLRQ